MATQLLVKKAPAKAQLPAARYRLRFTGADVVEFDDKTTGEAVSKLKLGFEVVGGKFAGTKFNDLFTDLVSPGSKLGNLLEALSGGGELPDDGSDEVNLLDFVGGEFSARVEPKASGYMGLQSGSCEPVDGPAPY